MSLSVEGITYYTMKDIVSQLSVSRQTLWRWRREGKIPQGQLFRDKQLLFTKLEFGQIEAFANRIEPSPRNSLQLSFLNNNGRPEPKFILNGIQRNG